MSAIAMIDLLIVILNYRSPELVVRCLDSMKSEAATLGATVVVVDNASADDSARRIQEWIDDNGAELDCRLVVSDRNGGFAYGNNLAIRQFPARKVLLVNSDTLFRSDAISKLASRLEVCDRIGLVGPRLECEDGSPQISTFRNIRPLSEFYKASNSRIAKLLFPQSVIPMSCQNGSCDPGWISFACVLIRRQVIEQIGYLDEDFFMYYEDADYCLRAASKGWKIVHEPASRVVHLHGKSGKVVKNIRLGKRLPKFYYASRTLYYRKHYGVHGLIMANIFWYMGRMVSLAKEILLFKQQYISEKAWRDIWTGFGKVCAAGRGSYHGHR